MSAEFWSGFASGALATVSILCLGGVLFAVFIWMAARRCIALEKAKESDEA